MTIDCRPAPSVQPDQHRARKVASVKSAILNFLSQKRRWFSRKSQMTGMTRINNRHASPDQLARKMPIGRFSGENRGQTLSAATNRPGPKCQRGSAATLGVFGRY